jgi:hypothetical protein
LPEERDVMLPHLISHALRAWKLAGLVAMFAAVAAIATDRYRVHLDVRLGEKAALVAQLTKQHTELARRWQEISAGQAIYERYRQRGQIGDPPRELWYATVEKTLGDLAPPGPFSWELLPPQEVHSRTAEGGGRVAILAHDLVLTWNNVIEDEPLDFIGRLSSRLDGLPQLRALEYTRPAGDEMKGVAAQATLRIHSFLPPGPAAGQGVGSGRE